MRKIGLKYRSLSGRFYSVKNNSEVIFESSLERDMIMMMEMDNFVHSYYEQPVKIIFTDKTGKKRSYTPDFLMHYHPGLKSEGLKPLLIEVKFRKDLSENFANYKEKFRAAIDFCKINNYEFRIMTENEIRTQFLENASFLYRYKKDNQLDFGHPDVELLLKIMCNLQYTTPKKLINLSAQDKAKQQELIYVLWYLVSRNIICCDWDSPINMHSEIWIDDLFANRYDKE
ncbi:TnsA endonuclease N-terminal domain-containing protein [Chryseobacterium sp. MEBOG07]|uniref:TnsA endonuclease N-terminal domain-containing protein n=1 Tax=Chryseobacterium sp. MEBOG07 TaxID=2879939 RepID=UPI001F48E556|nr:TnsA endonuclease N-terminal domain-containing protein [Chryseobacterium sp. MEBOG07]UKB79551.1 TnsA endonuclease N-terminal domain-containing protein [Chryseobacterium sp. MEBOG07]